MSNGIKINDEYPDTFPLKNGGREKNKTRSLRVVLFPHEESSAFQLDTLYTIWPTAMDA